MKVHPLLERSDKRFDDILLEFLADSVVIRNFEIVKKVFCFNAKVCLCSWTLH